MRTACARHAHGMRTACARTARYDYYLLCCPLLLIVLCTAFHFDLLSRWRNKMTMLQGKPYLAAMPLGSMIITQYEKQGVCSIPPTHAHTMHMLAAMHMLCTCYAHATCVCRAGAHIVWRLLNMRDDAAASYLAGSWARSRRAMKA